MGTATGIPHVITSTQELQSIYYNYINLKQTPNRTKHDDVRLDPVVSDQTTSQQGLI